MDHFAVGGRPLLSGRVYASIYANVFSLNRLRSIQAAPAATGVYSKIEASEASTSEFNEQQSIRAPPALHTGFDASTVAEWDPTRFEEIKKLQDAARNQGQVLLMRDTTNGMLIAVKKMPTQWVCNNHTEFVIGHPTETELPWQDLGCMSWLNRTDYAYSCTLLGVYRDTENTYVAMEYATKGDMFVWCVGCAAPSLERECQILPLAKMMCQSVRELHDFGIVHRDISMENVLLTKAKNESDALEVRLIDFSMAATSRYFQRCIRGKASYQAPEIHTDQEYDAFLSDSFAVGVTLYAVLLEDYPWLSTRPGGCKCFEYVRQHGLQKYLSKRKLRNSGLKVGEVMSEPLQQLLMGLLALDSNKRLCLGERAWHGSRRSVWDEPWLLHGPAG